MPEDAESPAPRRAKTRFEAFRYSVKDANSSKEMSREESGVDAPLNFRFPCFALSASSFLSAALVFFGFCWALLFISVRMMVEFCLIG